MKRIKPPADHKPAPRPGPDGFVVVRVYRVQVGEHVYPTATEASEAASALAREGTGSYAIAHVSVPLDSL